MNLTHDFDLSMFYGACSKVAKMIKKNQYYTEHDMLHAQERAMYIIKYNKDLKYIKKYDTFVLTNKEHAFYQLGNLKLGKNVLIWDLPSVITCKYSCHGCYAQKAERIYKNTRVMRLQNLIILEYAFKNKDYRQYLKNKMIEQACKICSKKSILHALRVHSSGDIYSKAYKTFLLELVKGMQVIKNLKIYTYTKFLKDSEINKINRKYNNFNIVKSLILGKFINFGNEQYLQKIIKELDMLGLTYYICHYGQNNAEKCMDNCHACLYYDIVLFYVH